jgi:NADPH:quinone reductase-like Zn-dependent oxidoreductase
MGAVGVPASRRPSRTRWARMSPFSGQIKPIIAARFPILQAAQAGTLLEGGTVIGNVVLLAPELL